LNIELLGLISVLKLHLVRAILQDECDAAALLAGQWTCDSQIAGSSPGWSQLRSGFGQATYTCVLLVTKQYNLVPAKGVISLAGKVTTHLVESNTSLMTKSPAG